MAQGILTALDIGTTRVLCLIADYESRTEKFHVVGMGSHPTRGVRKGLVSSIEETENAILAAVHAAEKMADTTIQDVVINISGRHLLSEIITLSAPLPIQKVTEEDVQKLITQASQVEGQKDFEVLHAFPLLYSLDSTHEIKDPRGMIGKLLSAKMHVITSDQRALKNILNCVRRCHLTPCSAIVSSVASGYASLTNDEIEMGVTLIDIGGDTTEISIFSEGTVVHTISIPVGGIHITQDIAHAFSLSFSQAETLKILHGSVFETTDDDKVIMNTNFPEKKSEQRSLRKKFLTQVIRPRAEELFSMVKARLESCNMYRMGGRRVVLTGGCSQLSGMKIMAAHVLGKQVRLGGPLNLRGEKDMMKDPSLSTSAGLLDFAYQDVCLRRLSSQSTSSWASMMMWIKENF